MSLVSNDGKTKSSTTDNLPELNINKCLNDQSGQSQRGICFEELAELISVSLADMSSLTVKPEKCAIIQETVSQIHRIQQAIGENCELQESEVSSSNSSILNTEILGPLLLEALDGFIILVNTDGKIEVVSENISYFLKYTKDDLLGKSIYNIIHVGDHARFSSNLLPMSIGNGFGWTSDPGSGTSKGRTFNCRFLVKPPEDPEESMEEKQTRVSQYENMQISTVLLPHLTERSDSPESETSEVQNLLFCVARRIPPSERNQSLSGIEQFTTRLDVTGKILAIDTSGVSSTYSQYLNKDLVERTVQELCHSSDLHKLKHHLNETLQVGSNTSGIYRLRIAHEKYIHVQTKSKRVLCNPLTSEQEFIMATHSIISRDPDLTDANQNNGSSSASGGSLSSSVGTSILTSSAAAVTTVNSSCSSSLYSSLTSLPSAHHDFSLDDLGLDLFPSPSWKLTTENSREGLPTNSTVSNLSPATSASGGSNSRMTLGSIQEVQLSNSAFTTEMSPVSRSPTIQVTSSGSTGVGRAVTLSSFSFSSLQCPPSNGSATPVTLGLKKMENETCVISDANPGNRNISLIGLSDHKMSLGTNPKLRNLLTQSAERTDSSSGNSPFSKMFNVSQSNLATSPENGLEMREISVATGDDNSNGSSRNVILRELLNQDEDAMSELSGKSRFPSGSGKSGMSLDMDSFRSDTNIEASKRPVNNNNMLRKLLNSEVESDRSSRKSQDMLIQQLLKAESPNKNENSVAGDANSKSSSSDQIFKDFGLGSGHSSNSSSLPSSLGEALSTLSKRKSDDNTDSGSKPPSKRPAIQHPHLAGQNPMLASMLAQTPKTEPSVPTTIANSIMSQLPQDRLPKNLEKKLIQTPCVVVTSGSSSISTQHGTGHPMSTNQSMLHQDVVTTDSRGHVTLSHHSVTTVNPSSGQLPQLGSSTQHRQYQGFLSRILNNSDGSQLTRALATASTNATISNQSGQSIYNNNFQPSNEVFHQSARSLTLSDLLGDVSSFDSVVGLTAQSQTSDPMLSQILDEVWSMQQEMETTPIDDNMIRKILDEVFEQPSGSSAPESVPSNNQPDNTVQDVHEKLAINAIQQQLMSYETSARSSTTTAHAVPSSVYIQSSGIGLGTVVPPNTVVSFSSANNYLSVPSLPTYSSGSQAGYKLKAQNPGVLTGVQQGVAVGNFQRPGGLQLLSSGGGLTPEVYQRLLERRQKMLQHQKRLRAQQQQQQVVQSSHTAAEPLTQVSGPVFPENTNDMLNNTVAPNVTLQRFNGITDQQLSPQYNTTLLGQTGQSQLSPGHQPPYSPLSQQSFPNPSPPVTSGYSQQHHRQPTYLPPSPVTVTGGGPQSSHLQAHSSQTQWNQRTAPNTTTTVSVQQQNPMLNAQLSQSSFSGQGRFITQAQQQIQVRSLSSPNSVTSQRNSPFPNQSDGQFQPQSPGHLYQPPSQAPSKQQRIQRVVSIPTHLNSPRTPLGGYASSDQAVSPQPQMSPSYTSPGNNYASTSGASDNSRFSFNQQSSQIYGSSSLDRGQGKNSTGGMTSEYVRQELRAMVGAKTQHQQQTQGQQFQYSLSGRSNPEGSVSTPNHQTFSNPEVSVSTPNHQTFNQEELDALVLSLDLGTGDSSSGLFPPSLLGVSNNQCSISQVPSHSPRDEEPKPADEKKSLLLQLLQHTPEPC